MRYSFFMSPHYIIGIDEVGRGPLAGPVVVAVVCIPTNFKPPRELGRVKDSKQLTAAQREEWSKYLRMHRQVKYAIARVNPVAIDRLNISRAANRAAKLALTRLLKKHRIAAKNTRIILDGGLYIGNKEEQKKYSARTLPKADERFPVVAYASIIAKVHRDRYMTKKGKEFPQYGFEKHKGYGTRSHSRALKKYGRIPLHRLTFTRKYPTLRK